MGVNKQAILRAEASARREAERLQRLADEAARTEALALITIWNEHAGAGRRIMFFPTLRAAIITGHTWLTVYCPGCCTERDVDIAGIDRHPDAAISSLIPALSCTSCSPNAPFAQFRRLSPVRPELPFQQDVG